MATALLSAKRDSIRAIAEESTNGDSILSKLRPEGLNAVIPQRS